MTTMKVSVKEASAQLRSADLAPVLLEPRRAGDVVPALRLSGKRAVCGYKLNRRSAVVDDGHMDGYMCVFELRPSGGDDMRCALDTLAAGSDDSWVFDLRANSGGSSDPTLEVASAFMGSSLRPTLLGVPGREPMPFAAPNSTSL